MRGFLYTAFSGEAGTDSRGWGCACSAAAAPARPIARCHGDVPRIAALCFSLVYLLPVLGHTAQADLNVVLEETIVVASRVADNIDRIGVSVSVINRDDIISLGYPDLGSILDTQPGVTVTMDGGYGKAAAVRIRGEEGFRTRIVLDGINIADPSSPQISPRIEHVMGSGLSRVEILRGPQGLLWGADAGGVILLSTVNRNTRTGLEGFVEAGSKQSHQAAMHGTIVADRFSGALSLAELETEGINARDIDTDQADLDGYRNRTAHGAISASITDALSLKLAATDMSGDNEYDGCYDISTFAMIHDCDDKYGQRAWRAALEFLSTDHRLEISTASSETERAFYSRGQLAYETRGENVTTSLLGRWQRSDTTRLTYGLDLEEQSLSDVATDRSRDNTGVYIEVMQNLLDGTITAGWRRDDNEDFGEHDSWRISARHALPGLPDGWTIRAALGTGFRAPSLYEIAYNEGPYSYPPAAALALQEETSRGWEVGLMGSVRDLALELIWFDQQIDEEIIFDLATYSGYLQTAGTSTSEGLEALARLQLTARWVLEGNVTRVDARQQNGADRPYRPRQTGQLSMMWNNGDLSARLTARHTGKAVDPFMIPVDETFNLDFTAQWRVTPNLSLEARLLNVTDQTRQQLPGYRTPGLTAHAGVRLTL